MFLAEEMYNSEIDQVKAWKGPRGRPFPQWKESCLYKNPSAGKAVRYTQICLKITFQPKKSSLTGKIVSVIRLGNGSIWFVERNNKIVIRLNPKKRK
jgi:hypothetical protein